MNPGDGSNGPEDGVNPEDGSDGGLRDLFAGVTPPPVPGVDSFEDVMRRYRRGRTRTLGVALALAIVAGPAVGIAVGRTMADNPRTVATAGPTGGPPATLGPLEAKGVAAGGVGFGGVPGGPPATRVLVRTTADGVTVRAYRLDLPAPTEPKAEQVCSNSNEGTVPCPILPPECAVKPSSMIDVELSDQGAVATQVAPLRADAAAPPGVLAAGYFGAQEGSPAAWVLVRAGDGVATVRARFSDGATDEMAPADGYAVLAHAMPVPPMPLSGKVTSAADLEALAKAMAPQGSIDTLDASGKVLATTDIKSVSPPLGPCFAEPGVSSSGSAGTAPAPAPAPPAGAAAVPPASAAAITPAAPTTITSRP